MRRAILPLVLVLACGGPDARQPPVTAFAAASLARPLRAITDAYRDRGEFLVELGGSMELARRLTDVGRVPDVLLLADDDVVAALMPQHLEWYVRFATSRLVLAYTARSRHAPDITADNWYQVATRPDVTIGRADSAIAPAGRHALGVLRRAGGYYADPSLSARLLERAALRFVRPNASELAALLEAGEVDYILEYESVARQFGFRFVRFPGDLSPAVLYGAAVPRAAVNPEAGVAFVTFLLGESGRAVMREHAMEVLRIPVAVGENVPGSVADIVRTMATTLPDEP